MFQVFDYASGPISPSVIASYGKYYGAVWGSTEPVPWSQANSHIITSHYFIMGMDRYSDLHHTLSWWQSNHPDWILYACDSHGNPTHDIAYMPGLNAADMPLDIHNPAVAQYQSTEESEVAASGHYTALAMDQTVFWNTYGGGNKFFGQTPHSGEYGCGIWSGSTFVKRYSSPTDPQWTTDVVNYTAEMRSGAHAKGMALAINHPAGSLSQSSEQEILASTDIEMDETGFSDYGKYAGVGTSLFTNELEYMQYAQSHGTAFLVIDKFVDDSTPTPTHLEYSIATYLLANDGGALMFAGGENGYGTLQYHSEYGAAIGHACSGVIVAGSVYSRAFSGGTVVVNNSTSSATFPVSNASSVRDLEGRTVSGTLTLAPHDAWVLLRSGSPAC